MAHGAGRTRAAGRRTARQQEGPPGCGLAYGQHSRRSWLIPTGAVLPCPMLWTGFAPISPAHAQAAQKETDQPKKAAGRRRGRPRDPLRQRASCRARWRTCARRSWPPCGSGRIEDLRHAYELNELKPDLGVDRRRRPGRALEADLGRRRGPRDPGRAGRDPRCRLRRAAARPRPREQPDLRLALLRRDATSPSSRPPRRCELLRLVPPAAAKEMRATGKYTHWRLGIGADGTWHYFRRGP